jgi:hypothetical protein
VLDESSTRTLTELMDKHTEAGDYEYVAGILEAIGVMQRQIQSYKVFQKVIKANPNVDIVQLYLEPLLRLLNGTNK